VGGRRVSEKIWDSGYVTRPRNSRGPGILARSAPAARVIPPGLWRHPVKPKRFWDGGRQRGSMILSGPRGSMGHAAARAKPIEKTEGGNGAAVWEGD
jgi:hypothetical protein